MQLASKRSEDVPSMSGAGGGSGGVGTTSTSTAASPWTLICFVVVRSNAPTTTSQALTGAGRARICPRRL